jgi:ABC-type uncharacterized transport system permease subunit
MAPGPTDLLYTALALYGAATAIALSFVFLTRFKAVQDVAFAVMALGFIAHTVFIGFICGRTGHPPLMNLPEVAAFLSWTILLIEMVIYVRLRIYAAALFVYPLVFALLLITAVTGEPFTRLGPLQRSSIFTAHLLLSTVGIAMLFVGLGFSLVATVQDRSLKTRTPGRLWDWIPSLAICRRVSYRALAIGFIVYTLGLAAGYLWSFREPSHWIFGAKQAGALVAWILFAVLVQSQVTGKLSTRRTTLALSAAAFIAVVISIFGIAHA